MRALRRRLAVHDREAGLTLIEMLVATAMSVAIVGGGTAMLISAVRAQPEQSKRAQNISTARYQLERVTREIRNGVSVTPEKAKASEVSDRKSTRLNSSHTMQSRMPSSA